MSKHKEFVKYIGDRKKEMAILVIVAGLAVYFFGFYEAKSQPKPTPTVSIEAIKDSLDGYNLHIKTTDYKWTPEDVNGDPVWGEGHAHVYVNDTKIARAYGEWFHIRNDQLQDGDNTIMVTLNANEHGNWVVAGEKITDSVTIQKDSSQNGDH